MYVIKKLQCCPLFFFFFDLTIHIYCISLRYKVHALGLKTSHGN